MRKISNIWYIHVKLGSPNHDQFIQEVMTKDNQGDLSNSLWNFNKAIPRDIKTGVSIKTILNGSNTGIDIDAWHKIYLYFGLDIHRKT